MEFTIVYETDEYMVVDKPASLVVNRSESQKGNITLSDLIREKYPFVTQYKEDEEFFERAGIVHRLDKETSGLILIGKNPESFRKLQQLFKDRSVTKKYITLVHRQIPDVKIGEQFEISAPILRNPKKREKFAISVEGKESTTLFTALKFYEFEGEKFTLLECEPKTGRTHQIRVHLTALGTPVAGDKIYSGKNTSKKFEHIFHRQFLHASYLRFVDPMTNHEVEVKSRMPEDLKSMIDSMKETV